MSTPRAPAVEMDKAIAKKALARLWSSSLSSGFVRFGETSDAVQWAEPFIGACP